VSEDSKIQSPDVVYCQVCKTAFQRPKNQLTAQCPNENCRAMVVLRVMSFTRSER